MRVQFIISAITMSTIVRFAHMKKQKHQKPNFIAEIKITKQKVSKSD